MSLPDEKTRALMWAKRFMRDLLDPKKTPKVPSAVRRRAYSALKHYPAEYEIAKLHEKLPKIFGPLESQDE